MFQNSYQYDAQDRYKNSLLRFLLQFTALGRLLLQNTTPTPSVFFNTYNSSWWLTRSLFSWMIKDTHLFYIIKSLSLLKSKLMASYGGRLNLAATIQEIKAYVDGLPSSLKHNAAKRCLDRITAPDYSFTDPSSEVSTLQLLALSYTAIHDETKRQGILADALTLFIEGLYEIQRGYNLNNEDIDDHRADQFICLAGTFNKIMEKLNSIHADVAIYYITKADASIKYKILVEEFALRHLRSIASPQTDEGYQQCNAILERMQRDKPLEPIWDSIKASVERDLWDEFSEAYGNKPQDIAFVSLMNEGWKDLEAPKELPAIQAQLRSLRCDLKEDLDAPLPELVQLNRSDEGMLTYLANSWFFENRHSSPEAQHHFDKQYGIVPFSP